jgi:hypothetical protein
MMADSVGAAEKYQGPIDASALLTLKKVAMEFGGGAGMCPNCDGRCARACGDSQLALGDIARYVNYYERDGNLEAREWFQAMLAHERATDGVDLKAASQACLAKLDFESITARAKRYFA